MHLYNTQEDTATKNFQPSNFLILTGLLLHHILLRILLVILKHPQVLLPYLSTNWPRKIKFQVLRHFGVPKFHQLIIRCDHAMMICHWFGESLFTILFNESGTVQGKNQWTYY